MLSRSPLLIIFVLIFTANCSGRDDLIALFYYLTVIRQMMMMIVLHIFNSFSLYQLLLLLCRRRHDYWTMFSTSYVGTSSSIRPATFIYFCYFGFKSQFGSLTRWICLLAQFGGQLNDFALRSVRCYLVSSSIPYSPAAL